MTVIIQCRLHCLGNPDPNRACPVLRKFRMFSQCESVHNYEYELTRNFAVTLQNSMTFGATAFPITGDICKLFFMIQHRRLSYIQRRTPVTQNMRQKSLLLKRAPEIMLLDVMTTLWQAVYIVAHFTGCGEGKVWKKLDTCVHPLMSRVKEITWGISFLCFLMWENPRIPNYRKY